MKSVPILLVVLSLLPLGTRLAVAEGRDPPCACDAKCVCKTTPCPCPRPAPKVTEGEKQP